MKNILLLFFLLMFITCKDTTIKHEDVNKLEIISEEESRRDYSKIPADRRAQLDSITPLPDLISLLRVKQELEDTDKDKWIGYNNLMYSIAVYGDGAIDPLMDLISSTDDLDIIQGVLYTLNLIGTDWAARPYYGDFINEKARKSLLSLLYRDELQPMLVKLLRTDKWLSDIPFIMNLFEQSESDCWFIVHMLGEETGYRIKARPMSQKLISILSTEVMISDRFKDSPDQEFNEAVMQSLSRAKFISVEDTLLHNYSFRYHLRSYGGFEHYENMSGTDKYTRVSLSQLYEKFIVWKNYESGNNFQMYMDADMIYIVSSMTAKKIWIDWWKNQSDEYKKSLDVNKDRL